MNKVFIFGLGAAIGSLLTWKLLDEKYKKIADEEIQSVKDMYNEKKEIESTIVKAEVSNEKAANPSIKIEEQKEDTHEKLNNLIARRKERTKERENYFKKVAQDLGYDIDKDDDVVVTEEADGSLWMSPKNDYVSPYVISPDEFGDTQYFENKSWTYYSDHIITDEVGQIVDDPEDYLGDCLDSFGEFEDDAVHVRNENLECDYEVIKVEQSFRDLNRETINDDTTGNKE